MLPYELRRLLTLIEQGFAVTQAHWPDLQIAYRWIHRAARILANHDNLPAAAVRRQLQGLLGAMKRWQAQLDTLSPAVDHFLKVTRSYWPGLFHCYAIAGLPKTNNDLEQLFGAYRQLERRITGHKASSGAVVVSGSVRLTAAVVTLHQPFTAEQLAAVDHEQWQARRACVDQQRDRRVRQRRFRQRPQAYLTAIEERIDQLALPPWFFSASGAPSRLRRPRPRRSTQPACRLTAV